MSIYETKIGEFDIEVKGNQISIVGDYNSNFGHFYPDNFERFKNHPKGEEFDWNRPQVIGMDWDFGMVPKVREWIYNLILDGKIEG